MALFDRGGVVWFDAADRLGAIVALRCSKSARSLSWPQQCSPLDSKLVMSQSLATVSRAQAQGPFYLGVDVGGTNVKLGVVDDLGRTLARASIPTRHELGPDDGVARIATAVRGLIADAGLAADDVARIGLATPGFMDIASGMLLDLPNLPSWSYYPVRDRMAAACERPVTFANDANAAAFGERWVGSGRVFHSIVLLTLGTGVGGGIIIGDLSIDGENSHGSECGHTIIDYHATARMCGCGQRGHLEAYASATALVKRTAEALAAGRKSSLAARLEGGETLTPLLLAAEADAGDALSLELILETAMYIGVAATSLMHTIDPGAVILGGAMNFGGHATPLGRRFLERVREEVRARAFPALAKRTTIDFASLGGDAGFIGAAGIARAADRKLGLGVRGSGSVGT